MANEAYNIATRKSLNDLGVDNSRIGFNPSSGYVSVDGKDIIKPQSNVDGTTYTDESSINSIRGNVNNLNNAYGAQQKVLNPQQQANPMDAQFNQLLQTLQGRITSPQAIDPYSTPQYAAAQQQMQQAADRGIRANQEATGASGFGRSTINTQGAQRIQNTADQNLQTQIVPQIIQQEQSRQQQELGNLMGLLGTLGQQQGLYDQRQGREFDQAAKVLDFLTGQQNRTEDQAFDREKFDYGKGIDTRNFDYTKGENDRKFEYTKEQDALAQTNLQEEKAFRQQRATAEDQQWFAKYQQDGQQFAAAQGVQWAQLSQRDKEFMADQAYKEKALVAQNDPNNLENKFKSEQLKKLQQENTSKAPTNIDEYDLIAVEQLAAQSGINMKNPKPDAVKNFVATQKAKNGWTVEEARSVESYLLGKAKPPEPVAQNKFGHRMFGG